MEHSKIQEYKESGFVFDSSKSFSINEIDGKELWLIKIPKDLPYESIPNKIQVSDLNKVNIKSIDINKKKFTIHQDDTDQIQGLFNVWSKNSSNGKMGLGKPFTKFIQIDESINLPKEQIEPKPLPKPKQQHDLLKGCYDPPGSSGFLKKVGKDKNIKVKKSTTTTTTTKTTTTKAVEKEIKKEKENKKEIKKVESESESEEEEKKNKSSKKDKKSKSKKQESSSEEEESSSEEEKKSKKSKKSSKKEETKKSKKSSKKEESDSEPEKKKKEKRKKDDSSDSNEQSKKKHKK
ncbi:hypothetical protein RB653_002629 [Dictyostelium firmibasis]|uniref:Uncharacterized protein n=1 Tax=Dictyostelium firmibasis TaxID=79012 RepID=A0AAN7YN69_9MYCE